MTTLALIFTLSAIGIAETVYLIRKRISLDKPICPIGGGCEVVLTSKYSNIFLIPNDIAGLITYIIISLVAALLVIGIGPTLVLLKIIEVLVFIASVMSIILTYLQWQVIKAWCFWCLMSAITVGLMAIILIVSSFV